MTAQRTLQEAEAGLSLALIDGDESGVQEVGSLRVRVDGLRMALAKLEEQRPVAMLNQKRRALEDLRQQVAAKVSELDTLSRKTAKHLEALSVIEGVVYGPGVLSAQRQGEWLATGCREPLPWHGPYMDCLPSPVNRNVFSLPKSRALRIEIEAMSRQIAAAELELAAPPPAVVQPSPAPDYSDSSYANKPSPSERAKQQ